MTIKQNECGMCGKNPAAGVAFDYRDGTEVRLCHGDNDPTPTCYSRWIRGERPADGRTSRDASPVELLEIHAQAANAMIRDILEAMCRNEELSTLDSDGIAPAPNYVLALRLGIGEVFGIPDAVMD